MYIETFDDLADSLWLAACISAKNGVSLESLYSQWVKNINAFHEPDTFKENPKDFLQNVDVESFLTAHSFVTNSEVDNKELAYSQGKADLQPPITNRTMAFPFFSTKSSSLDIQRTLRPLKRKVPSAFVPPIIDVQATIHRYAEEVSIGHEIGLKSEQAQSAADVSILNPVVRQGKERWLDVVLIIDKWGSMAWWDEEVEGYKRILEQSGVFRRVGVWDLYTVIDGADYLPRFTQEGFDSITSSLKKDNTEHLRLLDPSGRTVFLVLSDCISPLWDNLQFVKGVTGIGKILYDWGKFHPVSIVQMMPKRLWAYSGLNACNFTKVSASFSGSPNISLNAIDKQENSVPIPVMLLNPDELEAWANLVAGRADKAIPCIYVTQQKSVSIKSNEIIHNEKPAQIFLENASFEAQQLAGYLMFSVLAHEVNELKAFCEIMMGEYQPALFAELSLFGVLLPKVDAKERKFYFIKNKEITKYLKDRLTSAEELWIKANIYNTLGPQEIDKNGRPLGFWELQMLQQEVSVNMQETATTSTRHVDKPPVIETDRLKQEEKDHSDGFQVEAPNFEYLKYQPLHLSLWGEQNSGKTWLIKSLARHLFELEKTSEKLEFNISRIDHYGNTHAQFPIQIPEDGATKGMQDHLFLFKRSVKGDVKDDINNYSQTICFHDFPGAECVKLPGFIKTIYKHSDSLFLCLDFTISYNDDRKKKEIRDNIINLLNELTYYKNLRYLAVCITKKDDLPVKREPWDMVKDFLGRDIAQSLQSLPELKSKAFLMSSLGDTKKNRLPDEWKPEGVASPIFWILENEKPWPKQGYIPYPNEVNY